MENLNEKEAVYKELIDVLEEEKMTYSPVTIKKMFDYATGIYKDTKRYRGETTFSHAVHVAIIVAKLKIGIEGVYAAILHETPKFKEYKFEQIERNFGSEVAALVKDTSGLYILNYDGQQEVEAENLRKMFMAIAKDIRAVIIKLADRLYNMRNIYEEPEDLQLKKANETMQVYAPIAHRLGISAMKSEMEDIAFSIINPQEYERIKKSVELNKEERQQYINLRIEEIKKMLETEGLKATIYGRPKYYYSIFKKCKINGCRPEDLFDLYAVRIILNSVKDCYSALGMIHEKYKPMPGRFKDYIAVPKTNMYQSLHTTVFSEEGRPFEVQIRTWDMHKVAEYGVAAHFLYKEKKYDSGSGKMTGSDEKLAWLRKTIELEQEMGVSGSYSDIKMELFGDEVFVFTPKGEIKSLPKGSTTIDYAYQIHQHIGDTMVGAKINGKMVPITTKLKNSDVVEIVTAKTSQGPKLDWIKQVKTSNAKNKIVAFLKKQDKKINIEKGMELLEKEVIKTGLDKDTLLSDSYLKSILEKFNFNVVEECYENMGFGVLSPKKVINKLVEEYNKRNNIKEDVSEEELKEEILKSKDKSSKTIDGVIVEGIDNCLVKFAKCCDPLPGDDIVGYITFGKGVSIHRSDCPNLNSLNINERKIGVHWKEKNNTSYETKIVVKANDRTGITMDVLKLLQEEKVKISGFTARATSDRECIIDIVLEVKSLVELQKIFKLIRKVDSVYEVKRLKQ